MRKSELITVCVSTLAFIFISKLFFDKIYITSQLVIDEEFHLAIGEAYCNLDFTKWHPKVTTFPGLYLLSSLIFGAFNLCSTYWLRITSLACSVINVLLFYILFRDRSSEVHWRSLWSAINLALLPPLYFFGHLYYTDVPSLTMLLLMFLFAKKHNHYLASLFGMASVLFRQTNIIWIGMVAGSYILKEIVAIQKKQNVQHVQISFHDILVLIKTLRSQYGLIYKRIPLEFWLNVASYFSVFSVFSLFLILNGSIVVGDKQAHVATLHFPQIFYFSLFTLFFGWPHFIKYVLKFINFVKINKVLMFVTLIVSILIIHFNTIVHPYLLADNRHYIFYVWNRLFGYYYLFRYVMVPVYLFALYCIFTVIYNPKDITLLMFFMLCCLFVVVPQKLLEIRYFLVPYVLVRLQIRNVPTSVLICEFVSYFVINAVTLYLFCSKSIKWADYDYPQRLIW